MYEINFFNSDVYAELFAMLGGLMRFMSPFLMISVGLFVAGLVITLIVKTVKKALQNDDEYEHGRQSDDDARYERKHKY